MADEIRRSGRATKGQHTKNAEDEAPTAKPAAKGKAKGKKAKQEEVEEEEEDSIVRCICGATEDEEGWPMICCDKCEAWQHNMCMGLSEDDDKLPEQYFCEQCRPGNHKELLAAMKRGEKPWEQNIADRKAKEEEEARNKKRKKGGRKSTGKETPAKSTPVPEPANKRKFEETVSTAARTPVRQKKAANKAKPTATPSATTGASAGQRKSSHQIVPEAKRRKSESAMRRSSTNFPMVDSIDKLPSERQKVANALANKMKPVIDKLAKDKSYRIPDGETAASLGNKYTLQVEHELISLFGETSGPYSEKFRMIFNNIPKNDQLTLQLLTGDLLPSELVELTSDEMASEEVQRHRAQVKEEADKQAMLITETGPRMRKTHKGEEFIGGDEAASRPMEDSSWVNQPVRRREHDDEVMADAPSPGGSEGMVELPEDHSNKPALNIDTSRKQSSYNLDRVWSSAKSPDQPFSALQTPRTQHAPHSPDTQMHDADIDRLLKDEDDEDVQLSPVVDGSGVQWKGRIDMMNVAAFNASARWIAGGDVGQKIPYTDLIPRKMEITGRIAIPRADEYVAGMRFSSTNDVCCLAISPAGGREDRAQFERVFEYFLEKQRWGVINGIGLHEALRDVYLITLEKGAPLPDFLSMLEEKMIEEPRTGNMLILTMVVKTKSPQGTPRLGETPGQTPMPGGPLGQVNQQAPSASPVLQQGNGFAPHHTASGAPSASPFGQHPPQGPPQGLPQGPPQAPHAWATDRVRSLLGPHIAAPAVEQLFSAVPEMTDQQIVNLRDALEREPGAGMDLGRLGEVLKRGVMG